MKMTWMTRRRLLGTVPPAVAAAMLPGAARAQAYPAQEILFVCGFPAGSGADVLVRYVAEKVRPLAGKPVIVENKVGNVGMLAAEYVARAKPDGYTVYVHAASTVAAMMWLMKKPPIDAARDLQVAGMINKQPFMVAVPAASPYKTVAELVEGVKKKGEKASYMQSNVSGKVSGELFKLETGIKAVDIPYRTANESLNDFQSGVLDYGIVDPVFALVQAREGRIRNLAVTTPTRMQAVPDLPTMVELGFKSIQILTWFGALVPSATPRPVVDQINKWFNEVMSTEETKKFLNQFGGDPHTGTPDYGQALFLQDIKDWQGYVKAAKIEPQG
jgi:tripartite-type tricarboxylate transporter receptor subunit TctC